MMLVPIELTGTSVLVTRPCRQAEGLCRLIEAHGGEAVRFPTIGIKEIANPTTLAAALTSLSHTDVAVFLSPNAADYGLNVLQINGASLPPWIEVLAIGPATAARLAQSGVVATAIPVRQFDSEALLQLEALATPEGKSVLIFCGEGGRQWLANQLREAGARVVLMECYRRSLPNATDGKVIVRWRERGIDVVTLTSVLAADNLVVLLGSYGDTLLKQAAIVAISQRIVDHCSNRGWQGAFQVARHAGDDALLQAIHDWRLTTSKSSGST